MGQPIEEAARKAAEEEQNGDVNPVAKYAAEAYQQTDTSHGSIEVDSFSIDDQPQAPPSSTKQLTIAQQKFIMEQMAFIHDPKNLVLMFNAQQNYLLDLLQFIGETNLPTILTIQERYISELQDLITKKNMV
jgi:chemotaxis protein histidine kinase CheA